MLAPEASTKSGAIPGGEESTMLKSRPPYPPEDPRLVVALTILIVVVSLVHSRR